MSGFRARRKFMWMGLLIAMLVGWGENTFAKPRAQSFKVEITSQGYKPWGLKLRRGIAARVTFVRTTDATCVKEIVLPDFKIKRVLPLNQPVTIAFTPTRKGTFTFICGMNMMSGQLIVQ